MLSELFELLSRISPNLKQSFWLIWYQYLAHSFNKPDLTFMNFGFVDLDPHAKKLALSGSDETHRLGIQLYHHVTGAVDLRGLDVLDVGCGRGGGCSYIMRYLKPRSTVGLDFSQKAVELCNRHHAVAGLSFSLGDAESLPFVDGIFDVVISIESSHCYRSMERFLLEVDRVLRPNGYFLFADLRDKDSVVSLRTQLRSCQLTLIKEEAITLNVLLSLERDNERKLALIRERAPRLFRRPFQEFAGLKGTRTYESLRTGRAEYLSCVLHK